jgi:hypothetical protein
VLDHLGGGLLQVHLRLAGDERTGGVAAGRLAELQVVGGDAHRHVAVGDHRGRTALRIADHHRADAPVAHQLGHLEHLVALVGGDHPSGHDLAELHGVSLRS